MIRLLLIIALHAQTVIAVTLAWDASVSPDVTGYRVSWGADSHSYTNAADAGANLTYVFTPPDATQRYYLAVQAYDSQARLSDYSNEVMTTPVAVTTMTLGAVTSGNSGTYTLTSRLSSSLLGIAVRTVTTGPTGRTTITTTTTNSLGVAVTSVKLKGQPRGRYTVTATATVAGALVTASTGWSY